MYECLPVVTIFAWIISSEYEKLEKRVIWILHGFIEPFHKRQISPLLKIEKDEYP